VNNERTSLVAQLPVRKNSKIPFRNPETFLENSPAGTESPNKQKKQNRNHHDQFLSLSRTRLISPPGQNENVPLFNLLFSVIPISPEFGKKTPFNPSLAAPIRSPHAIYLSRRVSDQIGFR
jgi:hypothetical protein